MPSDPKELLILKKNQKVFFSQLHVSDSTCRWITDFLSACVPSPLLFSLYTNSCTSSNQSIKFLKYGDDTTLIGLISGRDGSAYWWKIDLVTWCSQNNL